MIYEKDILFTVLRAVLIAICTLGMMSALTTFKYSIKRVLCTFGVYLLWVIASSAVIFRFFDYYGLASAFVFTVSIPAIYMAYRMDKNSLTQAIFNYATQIIFAIILVPVPMMINEIISGNKLTHLLLYVVVYGAVIFLEYRFARKPFQKLLVAIPTGWGILSLVPIFFIALLALICLYPVHYLQNPVSFAYIIGIVITMLLVYFAVYKSLMRQYYLQMVARDKDVLTVQLSSMNKQADAVFAAEEKLRILRHDVRHFTGVMQTLLRQGGIAQAEEFLSTLDATIRESSYHSYCDNYMINSILTPYLETAEREGIAVKVNFIAPTAEQINETAFSVMLANALENALEACRRETEPSSIELKSRMFNGQYMMELSNTCRVAVQFDQDGLPLSHKGEGHGIGTRSIVAFAKEQNASVYFCRKDERFMMQMLLGE